MIGVAHQSGPNAACIQRMLLGGQAQGPVAGQEAARGSPGRQPPGVSRAGCRTRRSTVEFKESSGIGKNSPGDPSGGCSSRRTAGRSGSRRVSPRGGSCPSSGRPGRSRTSKRAWTGTRRWPGSSADRRTNSSRECAARPRPR